VIGGEGQSFLFIFIFIFILIRLFNPTGLVCPSVSYSSIFLFFDTSIVFSSLLFPWRRHFLTVLRTTQHISHVYTYAYNSTRDNTAPFSEELRKKARRTIFLLLAVDRQ